MRTFLAAEITDQDIINSISKLQSAVEINAKAVDPNSLHFTLQFLGEIDEEQLEKIKNAISSVDFSEFRVNFQGVGVFPKPKFPRIIWIGTDNEGSKALAELAKKVENALLPLGFKNDKPFKPHITVFRIKNKINDITKELKRFESANFGTQNITSFKLKKSILTSSGPTYIDLKEVKCKN